MRRCGAGLALFAGTLVLGCGRMGSTPPTWRNAPLSLSMPMVEVPAGEFLYGEEKEKRYLDTFWIDRFEVTNAQYLEFVRATDAKTQTGTSRLGVIHEEGNYPVRFVSHSDALAYARWLGKDLPTDEEWEKAARGTDGRLYPWGDEWDKGKYSYYSHGVLTPGPVAHHPNGASPYGAEDMSGNVGEWTKTVVHTNPWFVFYSVRGSTIGSTWPRDLVITERIPAGEHRQDEQWGLPYIGFRCVRRTPPNQKLPE